MSLKAPRGGHGENSDPESPPPRSAVSSLAGETGKFPPVRFDNDNWNVPAQEHAKIVQVAKWLKDHPGRVLVSAGARTVSAEYSRQVSDLRARTVSDALISAGVPEERILTVGYGEDAPGSVGDAVALHSSFHGGVI